MEDRLCVERLSDGTIFIGVFDGHGGDEVAQMCIEQGPKIMNILLLSNPDVSACIRLLYKQLDQKASLMSHTVGTTAAVVLIRKDRIWFSNCGDAMIVAKPHASYARYMSQDHKVEREKARLEGLGGLITYNDGCARIYGTLNIARSIGDHYLKDFVISDPYVTSLTYSKSKIDWLIIASDGLWDVFNPIRVSSILSDNQNNLETLVKESYLNGSTDNISIAFVLFNEIQKNDAAISRTLPKLI
jgi:serine/threonine protein phosphatase PrpC